jgi:universal stress protein E
MRKIQRILVAVKSPGAQLSAAVAKATQIARATGAHLELFHGVDTRLYVEALDTYENGITGFEALQSEPHTRLLEQLAEKVRRHGVSVSCVADVDYPVYEAILRRAEQSQADLIVTDCHAGSHIAPSLWRFTDWELMRLSPVPVLIVKRPRLYHRPNVLAAVDPSHAFSKPTQLDGEILDLSAAFSVALRGEMHVIHAFLPSVEAVQASTGVAAGAAFQTDLVARNAAATSLDSVLDSRDIPVANRHLVSGHPTDALTPGVTQLSADILVLGCIARSGVRRFLIGNTAEQLIYRVPCDLLMVKPPGFTNDIECERRGPRLMVTPVCN